MDRQTVEQYLQKLDDVMRAKIRPRTWNRYEQYVREHVLPVLGNEILTKL